MKKVITRPIYGNNAITLPSAWLLDYRLEPGDKVDIYVTEAGALVILPHTPPKEVVLA